jgi:hypothetical protein
MPCGVRRPSAFLVVRVGLPLSPSTKPVEIVSPARN